MGKKGRQHHLKRLPAPAYWPIQRKQFKWIVKPRPGPHKTTQCIPLLLVVREVLKMAKTRREARFLLSEENIKVDGKVRRDEKFPVGIMDVIDIPLIKTYFRILPAPNKGLVLHPINRKENEFKLCQIMNKTNVKGGHLQLNLNDGKNILLRIADPKNPKEDIYDTYDTLKIQIPNVEISDYLKLKEGVLAMVTGGKNLGRWGEVIKIGRSKGPYSPTITLKDNKDNQFTTIIDYVFAIGKRSPWVSMLDEDEL